MVQPPSFRGFVAPLHLAGVAFELLLQDLPRSKWALLRAAALRPRPGRRNNPSSTSIVRGRGLKLTQRNSLTLGHALSRCDGLPFPVGRAGLERIAAAPGAICHWRAKPPFEPSPLILNRLVTTSALPPSSLEPADVKPSTSATKQSGCLFKSPTPFFKLPNHSNAEPPLLKLLRAESTVVQHYFTSAISLMPGHPGHRVRARSPGRRARLLCLRSSAAMVNIRDHTEQLQLTASTICCIAAPMSAVVHLAPNRPGLSRVTPSP